MQPPATGGARITRLAHITAPAHILWPTPVRRTEKKKGRRKGGHTLISSIILCAVPPSRACVCAPRVASTINKVREEKSRASGCQRPPHRPTDTTLPHNPALLAPVYSVVGCMHTLSQLIIPRLIVSQEHMLCICCCSVPHSCKPPTMHFLVARLCDRQPSSHLPLSHAKKHVCLMGSCSSLGAKVRCHAPHPLLSISSAAASCDNMRHMRIFHQPCPHASTRHHPSKRPEIKT
mmetsp:Transcript_32878/g.83431  ORF Transcript_32878/g.83431 Transcript_32878/m.83431 type:complete len:234 (+) Transcript_32878:34-735(+)